MTDEKDRARLSYLASQVKDGVILEIGSKHGASASAMAKSAKVPVYCIDMWDLTFLGDYRPGMHKHDDSLFRKAVEGLNVIAVRGLSEEIAKVWDKPIGLLFIDGDHTYEACVRDYKGYSKHIIPGGYLVFHDYERGFDEVIKTVDGVKKNPIWSDWELQGRSVMSARRVK